MKRAYLLAVIALAGCMEAEAPAPPPALVKLQSACDAGDTNACAQVLAYDQRNRALRQQAAASSFSDVWKTPQLQTSPYQPLPAPRQTSCTTNFGVTNCTSY